MKINIILYLIFVILICSSFVQAYNINNSDNKISMNDGVIIEIQNAILEKNADWIADYSSYLISSDFISNYEFVDEGNFINNINYLNDLPDSFDWRNVNNTNWITSVKNQGNCGSCTAFGTVGALESVVQIELGEIIDIDLSEADLYYCNGGDCNRGISIPDAAQYVSSIGVSDELCFPYTTIDASCSDKSLNWINRVIKAKTSKVQGLTAIKNAIYQYGGVVSGFIVFEDFYYYNEGVYEHVYGNAVGGHTITIVGWNDNPGYWICKNSWGSGWGEENPYANNNERGYFRIKYNESGIGRDAYYFYDFDGNIQPFKPKNLVPSDNQKDVELSINLSWDHSTDFDGEIIKYNVYLREGSNVQLDDFIVKGLDENYHHIDTMDKDSYYSWFVVAEDEHGSQTKSDIIVFKTRGPIGPEIQGPSRILIDRNISYKAYPTEQCFGSEYYWEFDWGDDSNSVFGPFNECSEISASHTWTEKGEYSIGVRYKEDGSWSDWSHLNIHIYKFKSYNNHQLRFNYFIDRFHFLLDLFSV
jgi:hypothetical protein